jgi:hypothetical protein
MNNRDYGLWIIPLLAVLAVSYPLASGKQSGPTSSSSASNGETRQTSKNEVTDGKYDADTLIRKYLGADLGTNPVGFLIATVPDPIDSSLPHLFDRHLAAMQRGIEAAGYILDRFELPWLEEKEDQERQRPKEPSTIIKKADRGIESVDSKNTSDLLLHEREPGVMLFRRTNEPNRLLMVFLVGETPTAGIHKAALRNALNQAAALCAQSASANCRFRILAPTFSGSADSLINTLTGWDNKTTGTKLTIVTGSATVIDKKSFEKRLRNIENISASFDSTVTPDKETFKAFFEFLKENKINRRQVAILTEGNTAFGAEVREVVVEHKEEQTQDHMRNHGQERQKKEDEERVLSLTYPLHVSQLRIAAEKAKAPGKDLSFQVPQTRPRDLRLSLEEANNPKDVVANFSSFETFSTELVLSNLIATVAREGIRYLGLFSSDIRDQIFLAREIRRGAPNTVLFTFGADLLYLHSDVNMDFEGMLLFSTYPLFSMNQVWTRPSIGGMSRLQFPNDSSQGVYNATLQLLGRPAIRLEYGIPFKPQVQRSEVWLSTVGRNNLWPIKVLTDKGGAYEVLDVNRTTEIYSRPLIFALFFLAILAVFPTLSLIEVFFPRHWLKILETQTWDTKVSWWSKVCGDSVFVQHSFYRRPYLFCLSVSLLIFSFVLTSVFLRFFYFSFFWSRSLFLSLLLSFVAFALVCALMATVASVYGGSSFINSLASISRNFPRLYSALFSLLIVSSVYILMIYWLILWFSLSQKLLLWGLLLAFGSCLTILTFFATCFTGYQIFPIAKFFAGIFKGHCPRLSSDFFSPVAIAVFPLIIFFLACLQAFYLQKLDLTTKLFYHLRTVNLTSGLSPLLPLLFVGSGGLLWTFCSLRRLRMLEELVGPDLGDPPSVLHLGPNSLKTVKALEDNIKHLLGWHFLNLPGWPAILVLVGLPCFVLFVCGLLPSIEAKFFYLFFGLSFFTVYVALSFTFLRFLCIWWKMHRLLQYLSSHFISDVCAELPKSNHGMPKMDLSGAFAPYAVLRFSFKKAAGCVRVNEANKVDKILEDAAVADADGNWHGAIKHRHEAQRKLSELAGLVEEQLETPSTFTKDWIQRAHYFMAAQTVVFLHHVLSHLQNLIFFVIAGLLLMLLAINYYPFQPRESFLWFNWVIILTTISLTFVVFIQMGRDRVLSLLSGTTPGQVTWNREFVLRILLYVIIPVLALLGAQFPEGMKQMLSWVGAFQKTG